MNKFTFIIGGARSGKSRYAQEIARQCGRKVAFVATCVPVDNEMKRRISRHRQARPKHWCLVEVPLDLKTALRNLDGKFDAVIIDCLGLFVSNLLMNGRKEGTIKNEIKAVAKILAKAKGSSIVVSNEVGGGIVPDNALARQFRDILGLSNQIMSRHADTVYVMHAGIPAKLKG